MGQRFACFLVVFLLMFCGKIFAQKKSLKQPDIFSLKNVFLTPVDSIKANSIDPSYFNRHLTFFCKKELEIQKATTIPLRLRLGSPDYVNYLEKKPNAIKPGF
ncbi:MAG: hypothetical protein JST17_05395 [Bacteroidetes bacterium]|nr:hypothetical protein [Bacteroidota bacterium]MBS1932285.1 hypothetical protein [Bacteroidota bacterium]